jgi:hypothetical protein
MVEYKVSDELTEMFNDAVDESIEDVEYEADNLEDDEAGDEDFAQDEDEIEEDEDTSDEEDPDDGDDSEPSAEDDFDFNDFLNKYGDRTVTVTVQGEPVEVKVKDLPNGYMMREDYSRKTAAVAEKERYATWAQDVQAAFANDPIGTLQAFAQAYGIDTGVSQPEVSDSDPYEDYDPEVAAVLRRLDEQEARYQQQLQMMESRVNEFQTQQLVEEVKAEVHGLREEFGDDLDTTEMLRLAATYNMPLREAAEHVVGRNYLAKSKEQIALEAQAKEAAKERTGQSRQKSKKRASGTATKRYDASDVPVEEFNTISELFEIELNSAS